MKTIKTNPNACTNNTFVFNHVAKTIDGKEIDFKRAGIPGSKYEELLMERMAAQPTYTLNPIKTKRNPNKKTYAGLTLDLMKQYINTQNDGEQRMEEFNSFIKENKKYALIKKWFLQTYKGFSVEEAKRVISDCIIDDVVAKVNMTITDGAPMLHSA